MKRSKLIPRLILILVGLPPLWPLSPIASAAEIPIKVMREWRFDNDRGWRALLNEDYLKAEQSFRMAIELLRPYSNDNPWLMARGYSDLARVLYHEKRYSEAEPLAKWALKVREQQPRIQPEAVFQTVYVVALIEVAQQHYTEAEPLLRRALDYQETTLGTYAIDLALTLDHLAGVLRDQGKAKYAEAEKLYKRTLEILEKQHPLNAADINAASEHYAVLLHKMDRAADAEAVMARARELQQKAADSVRAMAEENARLKNARSKTGGLRGFK